MTRIVIIILFTFIIASCSTRVVYELQPLSAASPDAININTATVGELEKLPHVGGKTADAIVGHRDQHGTFRRVEHVMLIRGMSETRFIEIRDLIRIE